MKGRGTLESLVEIITWHMGCPFPMITLPLHRKMVPNDDVVERHRFFTCTSQNLLLHGLQEWGAHSPQMGPQEDIMFLDLISICHCLPSPLLHLLWKAVEEVWAASLALVCGEFRRRSVALSEIDLCETLINFGIRTGNGPSHCLFSSRASYLTKFSIALRHHEYHS
jgi:hypothetical protein